MPLNNSRTFLRCIFTIGLIIVPIISVFPQNYTAKTLTVKDGLANNNVRTIAEDSTGFLWIGTFDGLSRYDGYSFKNYYHIPGDTNSISYFSIRKLLVDKNNDLWLLTDRSEIILYNRVSDNFKRILGFNDKEQRRIYNFGLDSKGDLWVIYTDEILKRDFRTGIFTRFNIINKSGKNLPFENTGFSDVSFSGNKMWLIGPEVFELDIKESNNSSGVLILKNVFKLESPFIKEKHDFEIFYNFSVYESQIGNDWILSNIGLFKLDKEKATFYEYKGSVNDNEFTGKRKFDWASYNDGVHSYNPETHKTKSYKPDVNMFFSAVHQKGTDLMWVSGSSGKGDPIGLRQIVFTNSFFKNYPIQQEGEPSGVYSIVKDPENNLWVGIKGKDYITRITNENKVNNTRRLSHELFAESGHIRSMIVVKEGIWIGYYFNLLEFYNFKSGQFTRHYPNEKIFRTLAVSKEGNLFIGTNNLSKYYPGSGKTELLWKSPDDEKIYDLLLGKNDILWAGISTRRLLGYNTNTKETIIYTISSEAYHIEDICLGEKNDLWLTTLGEGVCNFDPGSGRKVFYTTGSGLSNNTTYSLLKDKSGKIWISTDNGISCLNPETGHIRIFNSSDGLAITEFNSDASYEADDGEFFFGGMGGFVGFYPDSLPETINEKDRPRILLTDLSVSGERKYTQRDLNVADTIILNKGENNFHLSFSSSDFQNSDKTLFRYRLDGIDTGWIKTDSHNRNVNFSNLKPGSYSFDIQSTNLNGEWLAMKRFVLIIKPYFYQTRLFIISMPLLIVLALAGFIILYIRQLKQKEKQKQDALKLQSLRGQMNPHFIFNSLNSINYFISNNDKLSANRYIADFSRLIRSILSNLGSDYIPFHNELDSIKDYMSIEHLRFGDKFDFEIVTDTLIVNPDLEIFPGLVQPIIENAIWHGIRSLETRKGYIKIVFSSPEQKTLKCIVEDNGIGRAASLEKRNDQENHKSRGINIVLERLKLISKLQGVNYSLKITDLYPDRKDTGTRVEIDIPVK